jgi:hypothetical protein
MCLSEELSKIMAASNVWDGVINPVQRENLLNILKNYFIFRNYYSIFKFLVKTA